ncbi:unnamed protein product, partial [Ectocarpus sp. 12 AP-2014]
EESTEAGIGVKSHTDPTLGGGVCRRDGKVSGRKAAVVIMAHMDRLAEKFAFSNGRVPTIGHAEPGEHDDRTSMPGNWKGGANRPDAQNSAKNDRDTYVVDISP